MSMASFRHGVHPPERKMRTARVSIERMPFVESYTVPLSQHIGRPSLPCVAVGDKVIRGQRIAEPDGFISTAQHAPVSGTVTAIEPCPHPNGKLMDAIRIRTDPYAVQCLPEVAPDDDLVRGVQLAGIVGLGGAAFPSHVKLNVPEGKRAEFLIVNGCECEPYLTCDHRLMAEYPVRVLDGLELIMAKLGARRGYVGIEANKADAVEALEVMAHDREGIEIVPLRVKYPQGAEKMLIDAVLGREVPLGKLPIDIEVVSYNVGSTAAIAAYASKGEPLIERIVTVTGPAVDKPRNLMVPVGTPIAAVLDYCGLDRDRLVQLVSGGPMMGQAQKNLDAPVIKGTSGLLALDEARASSHREQPCIRCGRCLEACPLFLNPSRLAALTRAEWTDALAEHGVTNCFECGSCAYVCPSHIPLAQLMRLGKAMVHNARRSQAS